MSPLLVQTQVMLSEDAVTDVNRVLLSQPAVLCFIHKDTLIALNKKPDIQPPRTPPHLLTLRAPNPILPLIIPHIGNNIPKLPR